MTPVAIFDIGTNSLLYLLAQKKAPNIQAVDQGLKSVRLGVSLQTSGRIDDAAADMAAQTLREFRTRAESRGAREFLAVGTRVFRAAQNGAAVARFLQEETGIPFQVLTEEEEARFSFDGAIADHEGATPVCVCDIGGGSTELILGDLSGIVHWVSQPAGAVVWTDRYFAGDPPLSGECRDLKRACRRLFDQDTAPCFQSAQALVAVGGTATTLAALKAGLKRYDAARVHGQILSRKEVRGWIRKLKSLSLQRRAECMAFDPRRADIILAGALILHELMQMGRFENVRISDRGLRYGIAWRMLNRDLNFD